MATIVITMETPDADGLFRAERNFSSRPLGGRGGVLEGSALPCTGCRRPEAPPPDDGDLPTD